MGSLTIEVFAKVRFLIATLTAFLATVVVLGGGGYLASQLIVPQPPMRNVFRTAAFEFELAPGWWCELDGSEYVCSPPGKPPYAAIAILVMKERNDQDNLKAYEDHLKQPQPIDNGAGREKKFSEVREIRRSVIGAHEWVEAVHSGSEIPNYDTYYFATITSELGILVTLSVNRNFSEQYVDRFKEMIKTLHVYQR
jgi:hypothetical protein